MRDSGVGIIPDLLPHIFDLFTQAERSLDRSQGGLGIGLALVLRLTELHGGKVEAFSELGHGSEFVVRLPVAPTDAPQSTLSVSESGQPITRPLRVLVVDDNVDTVLSFTMLLQASGHDVQTAHDGPIAVVREDLRRSLGDRGEAVTESVVENQVAARPQREHARRAAAAVAESG